jgi:TRAP-type C4-dicarboxylate transport system permease large subunit
MSAVHVPHPLRDHPAATRAAVDAFWVLAIGVIAAYAFFAALGAFAPGDSVALTIVVAILLGLFCVRAWTSRHSRAPVPEKDPRLVHARERRGF